MTVVIVYNGVSGSGKSEIVGCIKAFYGFVEHDSPKAKYLGLTEIKIEDYPLSLGISSITDYSTVDVYSRLLVKMKEGPQSWIDSVEYSELCKSIRDEDSRKLLVRLKKDFESVIPGCSNKYVLGLIEKKEKNKCTNAYEYPQVYNLDIAFVSIREPKNIDDFKKQSPYPVRTLFIDRPQNQKENAIDGLDEEMLRNYKYDYYISNTESYDTIFNEIQPVMKEILRDFVQNTTLSQGERQRMACLKVNDDNMSNPWVMTEPNHIWNHDPWFGINVDSDLRPVNYTAE